MRTTRALGKVNLRIRTLDHRLWVLFLHLCNKLCQSLDRDQGHTASNSCNKLCPNKIDKFKLNFYYDNIN